jgi:hypothetical protein
VTVAADLARIDAAIAEAGLSDAEAEYVKDRVEEGDAIDDAVDNALAQRAPAEAPEPQPWAPDLVEPQMTEQEAEREFKKIEQAAQRYLKTAMPIAGRLGMPVEPCPLCTFPGLAMPRTALEVTSDVEEAVLRLIGKHAPQEFKETEQYHRCDKCDGWGEVLTGAQKEISRTAPCGPCGGKGYLMGAIVLPPPAAPNGSGFPGQNVSYTPLPSGVPDQYGRPAGHPHWGLEPASVGVLGAS